MHGGIAHELKYLNDFGASPADALRAATISAAKVYCMEDSIGSLESRKSADLIGVEGDPLEDIETLKSVKTVILQGKQVL